MKKYIMETGIIKNIDGTKAYNESSETVHFVGRDRFDILDQAEDWIKMKYGWDVCADEAKFTRVFE